MNIKKAIRGMQIISKYVSEEDPCLMCSEHDIFYCGGGNLPVSEEDRQELDQLGWFISEDCDSWAFFT